MPVSPSGGGVLGTALHCTLIYLYTAKSWQMHIYYLFSFALTWILSSVQHTLSGSNQAQRLHLRKSRGSWIHSTQLSLHYLHSAEITLARLEKNTLRVWENQRQGANRPNESSWFLTRQWILFISRGFLQRPERTAFAIGFDIILPAFAKDHTKVLLGRSTKIIKYE